MSFIGLFRSAILFNFLIDIRLIDFEWFKELLDYGLLPGRFAEYCEKIYIPTAEEVESAPHKLASSTHTSDYFGNYNNLIFI